ncbi:MAG: NAD+ synthase [Hydrogenothermaceae bacterium]|nr:NAD+ synthase [Hydrogenothermaceae bacterium]
MKKIRVALAQINPVVGDLVGNYQKIVEFIEKAKSLEVDLVVFPELALTGYPLEDLLLKPSFIQKNQEYIDRLSKQVENIIVVLGSIDRQEDLYNTAFIFHKGRIIAKYYKHFLPNYGVFDENRYFQRGNNLTILDIDGCKIGISICEDIWYPENPINTYAVEGCELIVNINASPFSIGKVEKRHELVKVRSRDNLVAIAYVNLVGGQDELVFDGNSFIVNPNGEFIAKGSSFEEELIVADLDLDEIFRYQLKDNRLKNLRYEYQRKRNVQEVMVDHSLRKKKERIHQNISLEESQIQQVYKALVLGLRDYIKKSGFSRVVIGLSGGVDSSIVATIAVDALSAENVKGVLMPSEYTSKESIEDALELAKNLGIETFTIPISDLFSLYLKNLEEVFSGLNPDTTEENLQARIRGNILMALSNKFGWIVLATGNKSEMSVGYSTLYGDMVGGFAVIKDILKTRVYELCRYRNGISKVIPDRVLTKPPSAELRPNQTDEDELAPYAILDEIIRMYIEEDYPVEEIVKVGFEESLVKKVIRLIDVNEYKRRQAPIGIKITEKAFGKDRRMPIVNKFKEF